MNRAFITISLLSIVLFINTGCNQKESSPTSPSASCSGELPWGAERWDVNTKGVFCGNDIIVVNQALTRRVDVGVARYGWKWTRYQFDGCEWRSVASGTINNGLDESIRRCD